MSGHYNLHQDFFEGLSVPSRDSAISALMVGLQSCGTLFKTLCLLNFSDSSWTGV